MVGHPPFNGKTHDEIIAKIKIGKFDIENDEFKEISESAKDLLNKLLEYDSEKRITAQNALNHAYFKEDLDIKEINFGKRAKNLENFHVR
jgi:calcium-dependent protein kinase